MTGFTTIKEWAASDEDGRQIQGTIRKVPSQASTAGWWVDLSMAAGIPLPNYYASPPLEADLLDGFKGIFHGPDQSPAAKHLSMLTLMTPTAGLVGQYRLLDYLLAYSFVDGDDTGVQTMDNAVTLPRYTDGDGVMVMAVAVAPSTGGGSFTFNYVNQDGDPKTSPAQPCAAAAASIASLVTSAPATSGSGGPFLKLAAGDTGVRSITSVQFTTPNGGLVALVLVKPIAATFIEEINTPAEIEFLSTKVPPPRIYDGAYLGLIVNCAATVAAGLLTGWADTYWSEE